MSAASRSFARRARNQVNPFKRNEMQPQPQQDTLPPAAQIVNLNFPTQEERTPRGQGQSKTRVSSSRQPAVRTGKQAIPDTQYPIPNTQNPIPASARCKYYVQKHRVGKKTISTYIGINGAAADIEFLDSRNRQARLDHNRIARALIARLKHLHTTNENKYNEFEAQFVSAMTAAGFHRIDRHQWSKVRGRRSFLTPDTEHLTPILEARVSACRRHIQAMQELFALTEDLGHSKTACRVYDRYAKRAVNRLTAAERSLQLLHTIAVSNQNTNREEQHLL